MNYCEKCHMLLEEATCPECGGKRLRPVQEDDYCLLAEKEDLWAGMLEELLTNEGISCVRVGMRGAALVVNCGASERYRMYVPYREMERAKDLLSLIR